MKKGGLEGWRLLGRHFLYILTAACIVVTGWTFMVNPTTGLPTLFSFVGLLIPTWLLSGQEAVYDGSFWDLSPGERRSRIGTAICLLAGFFSALLTL